MSVLRHTLLVFLLLCPVLAFAQADQQVVSVVDAPDPVTPGQTLTYTITMTNNGPNPAVNGGFNTNLPGEVTYQNTVSPAGFTCATFGAAVSCTNPSWAPGTVQFTMTVVVGAHLANFPDSSFGITFSTSGVTPDPNSGNNSSSATTTLDSPQVDVSVAVVDSPDPVFPDGNITYTVDVTNSGPDPATSVNFNAFNSGTLSYQSITVPSGWSCPSQPAVNGTPTFTCTRASFPMGTSQFIVVVKADDDVLGINDGTVQIVFGANGTGDDTNDLNNQETESTAYVTPDADIQVSATDSPDPVAPDGDITYTVSVQNAGPDPAPNVTLNVPMNNTLRFRSVSVPAGWNCTPPAVDGGTSWSCTIASLPMQPASVFTIVLRANDEQFGINDQTIVQAFTAGSTIADPNNGNNVQNVSTSYHTPDANVSITAADAPDPVVNGANLTYTVDVTNAGPDAGPNATVNFSPHPSLLFQSLSAPAGWSCTTPAVDAAGTSQCTKVSFANGETGQFTLVTKLLTAGGGGVVNSVFTIGTDSQDPNLANNSIEVFTSWIGASSDLSITKTTLSTAAAQGSGITYTISTTNNGPDNALNPTINDTLPPELLFASIIVPAGWSCTTPGVGATGPISCSAAVLANGATATFTLNTTVTPNATGSITNSATTGSLSTDSNAGNSSGASGAVVVAGDADLSIAKSGQPGSATPGSTINYVLSITNNGPDPAASVTVTDNLPASLLFLSISAPGWSCSTPPIGSTGPISCSIASLPLGSTSIALSVTIAPSATGSITNSASIAHSGTDSNPGNSTTTSGPTTVTPLDANLAITKTTTSSNVPAGTVFDYTITISNGGPGTATGVVVNDTLPAGLELVSATPSQGDCTGTTGIACNLGTLLNGSSATITLSVRVTATSGSIVNSATVAAAETDGDGSNNSSSATPVIPIGGPASEENIPTLSEWMLLALMAMLGTIAVVRMRT